MLNLSGGFLSNFIIIPWELNVSFLGVFLEIRNSRCFWLIFPQISPLIVFTIMSPFPADFICRLRLEFLFEEKNNILSWVLNPTSFFYYHVNVHRGELVENLRKYKKNFFNKGSPLLIFLKDFAFSKSKEEKNKIMALGKKWLTVRFCV